MKRIIYLVLILALPALPGTAFAKNLFCNEIGSTDLMWEKTKQNFSTQGYSIPKNPATFAISNFDSKKPMLVGNAGNEELARKGDYFFEATPVGNINLYRWYRLDANTGLILMIKAYDMLGAPYSISVAYKCKVGI